MAGWIEVLTSGFVGNLVGGWISYCAATAATNSTLKRQEEDRKLEVRGLLRALYVEMNAFWNDFSEHTLKRLREVPKDGVFPVQFNDYDAPLCPVFAQLSAQIGRISDEGQIGAILKFYNHATALDAAFAKNNKLLDEVVTAMAVRGSMNFREALTQLPVQHRLMQALVTDLNKTSDLMEKAYADVEVRIAPYVR